MSPSCCLVRSQVVVGGNSSGNIGNARTDTSGALSFYIMYFATMPTILTARSGGAALALPHDHSRRRALIVGGYGVTPMMGTTEVIKTAG